MQPLYVTIRVAHEHHDGAITVTSAGILSDHHHCKRVCVSLGVCLCAVLCDALV